MGQETIKNRFEEITSKLKVQNWDNFYLQSIQEILENVRAIKHLQSSAFKDLESCERQNPPLCKSPFVHTMILYHLDRIEDLLNSNQKNNPKNRSDDDVNYSLLWPSIKEAFFCRLFSFLSHQKGRLLGYSVQIEPITITEILYLKCPYWLEPFFWHVLRRRKLGKITSCD